MALTSVQAYAGAIGAGSKAGIGAVLAVNYITDHYEAGIVDSNVVSNNGNIILKALSNTGITTGSAALAGSGKLAFAGSVSINLIQNEVRSFIHNSVVYSGNSDSTVINGNYPGITVIAGDNSNILSISGQVNISGKAGIGAASAYNEIANEMEAYIDGNSHVTTLSYVTVGANSDSEILTFAVGGGFGGKVSGNGSIAINTILNDIRAYIKGSVVVAKYDISLNAADRSQIGAIAGALGISGTAAVGEVCGNQFHWRCQCFFSSEGTGLYRKLQGRF